MRVDRAVATQILEAVSDRAVEAAIFASDQVERSARDVIAAIERDLEGARYEASLAGRRYELVDPAKRHVARELEARWNDALERVSVLERKIEELSALSAAPSSLPGPEDNQGAHAFAGETRECGDVVIGQQLGEPGRTASCSSARRGIASSPIVT